MPLEAPPNRGFAEYQRTVAYDGPLLYDEVNAALHGTEATPVLDVSRYAYVGGYDLTATFPIITSYDWFNDKAGSRPLGTVQFMQSPLIGAFQQLRLPNLGPYLQVQWSPVGGLDWTHTAALLGTNRYHPLACIPVNPVLIDQQNVALGAVTTATLYPTDYYAGPLQVAALCTQAGSVQLLYLNTVGTWDILYLTTLAANVWSAFTLTVPMGAWRIQTRNTSGVAGNFYTIATPNSTGSS